MFAAGAGFLTQAKMPMYMSEEWMRRFPEPLDKKIRDHAIIRNLKVYLEETIQEPGSEEVLEHLNDLQSCEFSGMKF
jgi:hypothetical protein